MGARSVAFTRVIGRFVVCERSRHQDQRKGFQNQEYMYLAEGIRIYSVFTVYLQGVYIQG